MLSSRWTYVILQKKQFILWIWSGIANFIIWSTIFLKNLSRSTYWNLDIQHIQTYVLCINKWQYGKEYETNMIFY